MHSPKQFKRSQDLQSIDNFKVKGEFPNLFQLQLQIL